MVIRAPLAVPPFKPRKKTDSPGDFFGHVDDLKKSSEQIPALLEEMRRLHKEVTERLDSIKRGPPGPPGLPGVPGDTPTVDHHAIAERAATIAAGRIRIPKVKNGDPGKNADPKEVIALVIELIKKGKLLKPEHIDGLTEEIASYRAQLAGKHYGSTTMVRGGGDTVAAGSGVTITTANGIKTISAGSGISTLAATETPDGSTTVFTFAGATAQPSYLLVDNVWMRATTKKGTVNWTWAAVTKQATLSVPAQDEILGIV